MLNKLSLGFVPAFVGVWLAEIVDASIFANGESGSPTAFR